MNVDKHALDENMSLADYAESLNANSQHDTTPPHDSSTPQQAQHRLMIIFRSSRGMTITMTKLTLIISSLTLFRKKLSISFMAHQKTAKVFSFWTSPHQSPVTIFTHGAAKVSLTGRLSISSVSLQEA